MSMKKLLLLFVLVYAGYINLSCKCGWAGNFLRVAPYEDLVVKARVLSLHKHHSDIHEKMEVEIIKTFKGNEKRKRIMVWGDDGKSCRPYIDNFKKGHTYYLALNPEGKDYEISVCGQYYLQVDQNQVKLQKNVEDEAEPKPMNLDVFEEKLVKSIP